MYLKTTIASILGSAIVYSTFANAGGAESLTGGASTKQVGPNGKSNFKYPNLGRALSQDGGHEVIYSTTSGGFENIQPAIGGFGT